MARFVEGQKVIFTEPRSRIVPDRRDPRWDDAPPDYKTAALPEKDKVYTVRKVVPVINGEGDMQLLLEEIEGGLFGFHEEMFKPLVH